MSGMRPGRDRDAALFSSISSFLGHGVQALSRMRLGRGRDATWFSGIFRQFLGHSVKVVSKSVRDAA
ncbi:Hypothetical predicted protein [Olea europaea subsp. europaea]|uniref:Uncharacterized protein n=1 Tax=Olea europaea subsp. europaea TaxID=158383 RepID=A0A8S0TQT8_OLEEU|nr:Hypothetical predicted protein [Olea europaea subsp. europaea]